MDSLQEEWREIPGHPNYEVSDLGRIKSLDRVIYSTAGRGGRKARRWKGRLMQLIMKGGYTHVHLGSDKLHPVYQLVALAWLGSRPRGLVVNHKNGIKLDNSPGNLEYVTNEENVSHAHKIGLMKSRKNGHYMTKLSVKDVEDIQSFIGVKGPKLLASEYGVHEYTIRRVWDLLKKTV